MYVQLGVQLSVKYYTDLILHIWGSDANCE
jgi:hypothetical protein